MHERHGERQETGTPPTVARFYDTVRSGALSAAALAHGDADIGQECVLTPDEIFALARRAGITATVHPAVRHRKAAADAAEPVPRTIKS